MGIKKSPSNISIDLFTQKIEEEKNNKPTEEIIDKNLPKEHFADKDIQDFWQNYILGLRKNDPIIYNAIRDFKMYKKEENCITIQYPSESSKTEFDKISSLFFSELKHKINNFHIQIEYKIDITNMRKERITKRSIFEKMIEKNPALMDLHKLFKFDLND